MAKINLNDVFVGDYLTVIGQYKDRLNRIFQKYEIALFMARKAICFYTALNINGEINRQKCRILSSRITDYNSLESLKGKRIAVIDDIVVKGDSIKAVANVLKKAGINADYYVVACEERFVNDLTHNGLLIQDSYSTYQSSDIYQMAALITRYIEASMCSFNVDSPVFEVKKTDDEQSYLKVRRYLQEKGLPNITSENQKSFGIDSYAAYFEYRNDTSDLDNQIIDLLQNSIIKIRYYVNDERIAFIPFVLLPSCDYNAVDKMLELISNEKTLSLINNSNQRISYENKSKLISYVLSQALYKCYAKKYFVNYFKISKNDTYQFGITIESLIEETTLLKLEDIFKHIKPVSINFHQLFFSDFLKAAYEYIFSIDINQQPYENSSGAVIGNEYDHSHEEVQDINHNRVNYYVFTLENLREGIKTQIPLKLSESEKVVYLSSIIDVFIDLGLIVPSIVHLPERDTISIIRGYKMGEYSKLTVQQIYSFARMLFLYQNHLKSPRGLDKIEMEKLCVLYFQKALDRIFKSSLKYEAGCYTIAYSLYGPRISEGESRTSVSTNSSLITQFIEVDGYINRCIDNKWDMDNKCAQSLDGPIELFCLSFSTTCAMMANSYTNNPPTLNKLISSYDQLLTLLAIGNSKKEQMLSLVAEVKQVLLIDPKMFEMTSSRENLDRYKRCLSGINNGLWKIKCYKENILKNSIPNFSDEMKLALGTILTLSSGGDTGNAIKILINMCEELLFQTAFFIEVLIDRKRKQLSKRSRVIFNELNDFEKYSEKKELQLSISQEIDNAINQNQLETLVINKLNLFLNKAYQIIDGCDLYLEHSGAYLNHINNFIVLQDNSENLPALLSKRECILKDITLKNKVAVFSALDEKELNECLQELLNDMSSNNNCTFFVFSVNQSDAYSQIGDNAIGYNSHSIINKVLDFVQGTSNKPRKGIYHYYSNENNCILNSEKYKYQCSYKLDDGNLIVYSVIDNSADLGDEKIVGLLEEIVELLKKTIETARENHRNDEEYKNYIKNRVDELLSNTSDISGDLRDFLVEFTNTFIINASEDSTENTNEKIKKYLATSSDLLTVLDIIFNFLKLLS